MTIQDRIKTNFEYFRCIEMAGTYPILKVQYPEKWGVYPSKDGKIKVARSEDTANEWFYYTTDESIDLDAMFDMMEQTITMNLSAIAKIDLLREKVEELKEVFSSESLERLKTLKFTFAEPKKTVRKSSKKTTTKKVKNDKPKRKYTKKNKVTVPEVVEENNETANVTVECLS